MAMGPKPTEMVEGFNSELRTTIRGLALQRGSRDRRQLYWALIKAQVWTPVRVASAAGHVLPGDLHPLYGETLGGSASYCIFTHEPAAEGWQRSTSDTQELRLERIQFVDLLPLLIAGGVGSLYINPEAKFSGELYRHELETCLEGARKVAAQQGQRTGHTMEGGSIGPAPRLWDRIRSWLP